MQVEPEGPILENVRKVVVHPKAIALRMDTVETEYKARIEELEKQDPNVQLRAAANEIVGLVAYRVKDMTHLLETPMESWSSIEQIDVVEEVCKEIRQTKAEIGKLTKEPVGLTPVQRMVHTGKRKKLQIQLQ